MKPGRVIAGVLLVASIAAGTFSDAPRRVPPPFLRGYQVLAADFHVHSFPFSSSTLTPWDTVIEARRQGLDVIAMTPHNHTWVAKVGQWFSKKINGPIVLTGEEIVTPHYHLLAIGIRRTISPNLSAATAIDEIHRQGGVAIAAHPTKKYWPAYDAEAMRKLDGAEVVHPIIWRREDLGEQLRQFYGRAHLTAVGDSDYHGLGPVGLCRTYVFTHDASEQGILDAVRKGQTVVYDRGQAYGDRALIQVAEADGRLPDLAGPTAQDAGFFSAFSRITAILGMLVAMTLVYPIRSGGTTGSGGTSA